MLRVIFIGIFLVPGTLMFGQRADVEGSKDYELLNRMPDYFIRKYWEYDFDQLEVRLNRDEVQQVEGKKYIINFEHQDANNKEVEKPSYLQILRNYSNAIKKKGGEIVFEHRNSEYGYYYLKTKDGKEIWIEVKTAPNTGRRYLLTVVEREVMEQEIELHADLIQETMDLNGKMAFYGIYFDVGKADILPESKPALDMIAEYLTTSSDVKCYVVGHTDMDGSLALNMDLSMRRAQAVKAYLEKNAGIASDRLIADGVGPLAPVSTNETEFGKKMNRRVELVKQN